MMTKDQVEIVKIVYSRFLENEEDAWTDIDDNLEMFGWLSIPELIRETRLKYDLHCEGAFRCSQSHPQEFCFAPRILEAVEAILMLYSDTEELHEKNAYILTYYLVMSEMGLIFSSAASSAV